MARNDEEFWAEVAQQTEEYHQAQANRPGWCACRYCKADGRDS